MELLEHMQMEPRRFHAALTIFLTVVIGTIDYVTGVEFRMEIFYLMPIAYATWFLGRRSGIAASAVSLCIIFLSDYMSGKDYNKVHLEIWNLVMYLCFFIVVTMLMSTLRLALEHRADLIEKLRGALSEVKELSGILPICANCHKIRNDEGYWLDVADYISRHTNAKFSHGICQECTQKLYPAYFKKDAP